LCVKGRNYRKKDEEKRVQRATLTRQLYESRSSGEIELPKNSLWGNSIFMRIRPQTVKLVDDCRVASAILSGAPKVVLDCSFTSQLSSFERRLTAEQVKLCISLINRQHKSPFHLHLTNVKRDYRDPFWGLFARKALSDFDNCYDYLSTVSEQSYMDLFPREQLVYLTGDARQPLMKFDSDRVYVIGAIVDKTTRIRSITTAKERGIETRRLPLDNFVKWQMARKTLCFHQVLGILLDVNLNGGDWLKAIETHVPKRFIDPNRSQHIKDLARRRRLDDIERLDNIVTLLSWQLPDEVHKITNSSAEKNRQINR